MSINDWRLYGSKKAQAVIDVSAPPNEEVVEEVKADAEDVDPQVEEVVVPTSASKKAVIRDYLLNQGHDESELGGLTKAELLSLV